MTKPVRLADDDGNFVELRPRLDDGRLSGVYLAVRVSKDGFNGRIETWIEHDGWLRFAQDLTSLEATLDGRAELESASPGELRLVARSLNNRSQVGLEGSIGLRSFDRELTLAFSVFAFEVSQLGAVARCARLVSERLGTRNEISV